jgi:SAM-dependent methyltransferase
VNNFLHGLTRAVAESFDLPQPIVEIGSYQVAGQEAIGNLRGLFPGHPYLGLDMRPGPGVDLVANVENLPQDDASAGTVLALSTFEHVRRFWRGFEEIHRVLRPDGALLVAVPFYFRIHQFPSDYWRFSPSAFEVLLEPYPQKIIGWQGPARRPLHVWALAFREEYPPITPRQFELYRKLLARYAREPLFWGRCLCYRLASLFCGRKPFATYLDRNRWQTSYHATPRCRLESEPEAPARDAASPARASGSLVPINRRYRDAAATLLAGRDSRS